LKLFVDENLMPALAEQLASIYRAHQFRPAAQDGLLGVDDLDLLVALRDLDYDAIITLDRQQLANDSERSTLAACGLHWVGVPELGGRGVHRLALVTAVAATGMHHVIQQWQDAPRLSLASTRESR
jgi:hypothetical protein